MKQWYQCKVNHARENEEGIRKQVSDLFLVDAVSYGDAEARIYEAMEQNVSGEFNVLVITKTNISEVIATEESDLWFKSKVYYSTIDGNSEKEVKITSYLLVNADDVESASKTITKHLEDMLVPFNIPSISVSNILEVFPFSEN